MKYFIVLGLVVLGGCAWLQSHPEVENEIEAVGEEVAKDGLQAAEQGLSK